MKIKIIAGIIIGIVAVLVGLGTGFMFHVDSPIDSHSRNVTIEIPRGSSLSSVRGMLDEAGLIKNRRLFMLLVYLKDAEKRIGSGEYSLDSSMSPREILDKLTRGEVKGYTVSFPEGFTVKQVAARLEARGLVQVEDFMKKTSDSGFLSELGIESNSLEGYLFPETYILNRSMGSSGIIRAMVSEFRKKTSARMIQRAEELGLSMAEIITLASIVEKEGGSTDEKSLVAAVFHNRLKRGMRLQSDPTVIYGLKAFDGNLKKKHLQEKTPYNTYQFRGLPPGPICNPGLDSIMASLYPAEVDYLYFVSKNDGTHHFSSNLKNHNEAVVTYQIKRRRRK